MPRIQKLEQALINQIAAGEVVERPASVVKELIENSLDAHASKISVVIEGSGKDKIQVIDDGNGMDQQDAEMAFTEHATSKISSEADLSKINTMGFRGEALASIASISKVTLVTRERSQETGYSIQSEGGEIKKQGLSASPKGTNISVEDLFFNTPARKKFLKADSTEFKHITDAFITIATSHCQIHFELHHNGKQSYNLPRAKDTKERISDIFGTELAEKLISINYQAPQLKIEGYAGHPSIARTRRSLQHVFLNNRPIQDNLVLSAAKKGYESTIPGDRFPVLFIFMHIDPQLVDVNVHPRKLEVKFLNSSAIFSAVKQAISTAIHKSLSKEQISRLTSSKEGTPGFPHDGSKKDTSQHTKVPPTHSVQESLSFTESLLREPSGEYKKDTTHPAGQNYPTEMLQVFETYIVIERNSSLLIIDQHAAAERVTFEKLKIQYENKSFDQQQLLTKETFEVSAEDYDIVNDNIDTLKKIGLEIEPFGKNTFALAAIPIILNSVDTKTLFEEMVDDFKKYNLFNNSGSIDKSVDKILATMACHSSIRAGMKLEQSEMQNLVQDLLKSKNPYSCPHGRAIVWEITISDIEKHVMRH